MFSSNPKEGKWAIGTVSITLKCWRWCVTGGSCLQVNWSDLSCSRDWTVVTIWKCFLKTLSLSLLRHEKWGRLREGLCGSKKYPFLPHGRDFSLDPPPLCKFQSSFIYLLKCLGLWEPPTLKEFPIPSVGGVWMFSGTTHWEINIRIPVIVLCFKGLCQAINFAIFLKS